ncbi:MAG: DUF475 domain-containing protein [Minisyncoccia bacterium]
MAEIFPLLVVVVGLTLFEIISSIDNAVINAEVLSTVGQRARRWFLTWGMFFAVFVVRGILPFLIVFLATPSLGIWGTLTATFSSDPAVIAAIEKTAPILLMGGGTFLVFLFLYWLFMEEKKYGFVGERFIHRHSVWFYAATSIFVSVLVWFALKEDPILAFAAVVGSTGFFIIQGFKDNAAKQEQQLLSSSASDISKVLYLEALDLTFSIDGVLGAFAFTFAVPLILLGNGIGAIVLRQITVSNIERIKRYAYLKNGAMYSILALGAIMVAEGFGAHIPYWISPIVTIGFVVFFFWKSLQDQKRV